MLCRAAVPSYLLYGKAVAMAMALLWCAVQCWGEWWWWWCWPTSGFCTQCIISANTARLDVDALLKSFIWSFMGYGRLCYFLSWLENFSPDFTQEICSSSVREMWHVIQQYFIGAGKTKSIRAGQRQGRATVTSFRLIIYSVAAIAGLVFSFTSFHCGLYSPLFVNLNTLRRSHDHRATQRPWYSCSHFLACMAGKMQENNVARMVYFRKWRFEDRFKK